ncbi:MAG TPA: hypothetical protein PKM16_10190 [Bacteroidia bacterium]|nr:hypothetical protein [Bacteroidia bacterium]
MINFRTQIGLTALLMFLLHASVSTAQTCGAPITANCNPYPDNEMLIASNNTEFIFDSFTDYLGGITLSGSTTLRLKVDSGNVNCKWKLAMIIDNNPGGGTPATDWETLNTYGSSGTVPTLDAIEVKVYNGCNTPINNNVYQTFFPALNGSNIDIINDVMLNTASTPCVPGVQVNSLGSYITNYNEFTFQIDYRVKPGFVFNPGIYALKISFCLVEI